MRIRTIKPSFWTSPDIAALPDDTHRLFFVGLWNYADDEGRGVDDPRIIKGAIFPLNDEIRPADVDAMMWRMPSVIRYTVASRNYFEISTWGQHQKISHPRASDIPKAWGEQRRHRDSGNLLEASGNLLEASGKKAVGSGSGSGSGSGTGKGKGKGKGNGVETAARSVDNNPNQPTDRQIYFAEKFDLGIPAIVKLNKAHGRANVLSAMEQLHGFPPDVPVEDHYGWIATVADIKAVGA